MGALSGVQGCIATTNFDYYANDVNRMGVQNQMPIEGIHKLRKHNLAIFDAPSLT